MATTTADAVFLDGKKVIPVYEAARRSRMSKDHIAALCRRGMLDATMIAHRWFVSENSLSAFA